MSKTASLWAESFWSKSTPVLLAFVIFAAGCGALAQDPVTIVPTWDSTITSDPNAATIEASIQATITRVEADITAPNPDTVNITFAEMGSGLGESSTVQYTVPYSSYVSALQANATPSANDTAAIASLNYNPTITTNNPVNGNADVNVNTALARGLGIANYGSSDGTISLNTSIMNLSRTGTQNPSDYDIQAVAGHEIDEVLGIGGPGSVLYLNGSYTGQAAPTGSIGVLDLFRYASVGVRSFTLNPAVNAYFSVNGGTTRVVYFDQNNEGSDFADWGNGTPNAQAGNTPAQLQDSYGTPGVDVNIGTSELTALDVVGYNLTAAPEPGSLALLAAGAGALLGFRRRRRTAG